MIFIDVIEKCGYDFGEIRADKRYVTLTVHLCVQKVFNISYEY